LISKGNNILINCPSCGSNFEGDLRLGCPSCGARSVGPPLAKAEHQLPSYGRAVVVSAGGVAMSGVFLAAVIAALVEFGAFPPRFGSIINAGEVAAWRLKWVMLPVALIVLWSGARIIRSIKQQPSKFIGLRAARLGFMSTALVTLMIGTLIGVTIPERLRQRQAAINASIYSRAYSFSRAQLAYRELHGFIPGQDELITELKTLPDPDGSIADALLNLDVSGYQASTIVASATSKGKPLAMRGNAIRSASTNSVPAADHGGVSFTNYEVRLPGEDKVLNNDDDLIIRDGLVMTVPEYQDFISARTRVP
jgi:hypothetical protein